MLAILAIRALEAMFAIGMVGCVLVLIPTTIEDIRMLLGKDESKAVRVEP